MLSMMIAPMAFFWAAVSIEKYAVNADSMAPNFVKGDLAFGRRDLLGFGRFSYRSFELPVEGRIFDAPPKRGDVVSFRLPADRGVVWIKRVVGMPGDMIQMIGGVLQINGKSVELTDVGPYEGSAAYDDLATVQRETLPGGAAYTVLNLQDGTFGDEAREFKVPAGHYFVLGDNRDNSNDSRFELGSVPAEDLVAVILPVR